MTQQLEDRLRAAFRERAGQIPPVAPPLELTPPRRAARPGLIGGLGSWLTPGQRRLAAGLAAAAAVAAIAVGTVVAPNPPAPPVQPVQPRLAKTLPPYYVAISQAKANSGWVAVVRATRTGAVIARIPVPRPYTDFTGVTAAGDDRTFVLQAVSFAGPPVPEKFFLLRIDPGARSTAGRARLTPLDVRLAPGAATVGMALSPDGTSLAAVALYSRPFTANRIIIYNLSTGASHSWQDSGCADNCVLGGTGAQSPEVNTISWTADGRQLGFVLQTGIGAAGQSQFRVLNVSAPGDDVLADSQPVTLRAAPGVLQGVAPAGASWGIAVITPDGSSIVLGATNFRKVTQPLAPEALLRYSARTGALRTVLGTRSLQSKKERHADQVLWTSPDGSTILVSGFRGIHRAGLLHDGHYTPIPWSPLTLAAAW
ncbi:MAG TPA: hypothetical protein VH637_22770 [Streptosporangiaceae bacterium]|jgi:hypothetical protein